MNEAFQVLNSLKVPVQKQFTSKKGQEVWGHTQAAPNAVVLQGKDGPTRISSPVLLEWEQRMLCTYWRVKV